MIKSRRCWTRKPGMTNEQFVKHWLEVHGRSPARCPGYGGTCSRTSWKERTRPDIPSTDVEIDGVAELWYDDRESMLRALPPRGEALYADGALFIGRIKSFTIEERRSSRGGAETQFSLARSAMSSWLRPWGPSCRNRRRTHIVGKGGSPRGGRLPFR